MFGAIDPCVGRVKLNTDPTPGSLVASMVPPCSPTNSLHNNKPRPVPYSPPVPSEDWFVFKSNSCSMRSLFIPTPVSEICMVMPPLPSGIISSAAPSSTLPPFPVNLMALLTRLRMTVLMIAGSTSNVYDDHRPSPLYPRKRLSIPEPDQFGCSTMNLQAFKSSVDEVQPPHGVAAHLVSLWFQANGDLEAAHRIR